MSAGGEHVSVILPVYNGERHLREALDSVLRQTHPVAELIVVDDGSTDDTAALVRAYGPPVRYLHQANRGVGSAYNTGVAAASSEFLAFHNSDDLYEPDKLARQLAAFRARPDMDVVFAQVRQFHSPELSEAERRAIYCPPAPDPGYLAAVMLVRRAAFLRVGPFPAGRRFGEFVDWYARAREAGLREIMLPDVLFHRRLHGANLSIRHRPDRTDFLRVVKAAIDRRRPAPPAGTGKVAGLDAQDEQS